MGFLKMFFISRKSGSISVAALPDRSHNPDLEQAFTSAREANSNAAQRLEGALSNLLDMNARFSAGKT